MARPLLPPGYLVNRIPQLEVVSARRPQYAAVHRGSPRRPLPLGRRNRTGRGRRSVQGALLQSLLHSRGSLAQRIDAPFLHQLPGGDVAEMAISSLPLPDVMKDVLRNPIIGQLEIAADVAGTVAGAVGSAAADVVGGIASVGSAAFGNTFRYDEQGGDVSPPNDAGDRLLA